MVEKTQIRTKREMTHMNEEQGAQLVLEQDDVQERELLYANGASQVLEKERGHCCVSWDY